MNMSSEEYARKKHIVSVRAWQKRNPEKVKAYKRGYYHRQKKDRRKDGKEDDSTNGN